MNTSFPDEREVLHSGPERAQLESWLDFERDSLLVKCDALSEEQLKRRPVATSTLSLLGLVRHLTFVEQVWFEHRFAGLDTPEYYKRESDRDADFNDLDSTPVAEVFANFERARTLSDEIARAYPLETMAKREGRQGLVDLRWIYLHLIEEYARHLGHADLLREMIDGATGL